VEASVDGARVRLGAPAWCGAPEGGVGATAQLWLAVAERPPVRFSFTDQVRPDARETVAALARQGLEIMLLSGDRPACVEAVAREVAISNWAAGLTPADKNARLIALRDQGRRVLMVGDGLNDAPALAAAHVSIAPANAIDASQAASDLVLQGASLAPIVETLEVARIAKRRALENLGFSAFYNACAIPLAVVGIVTPLIAAVAMSASSLIVTLNALRLASRKPGP